jgi:hypothetical protein
MARFAPTPVDVFRLSERLGTHYTALRFPKELTRMNCSLLASRSCRGGAVMLTMKIHFAQVPLRVAKRIAEREIRRQKKMERSRKAMEITFKKQILAVGTAEMKGGKS